MDSANFTRHNVSCDHCDTLLCLLLNGWQRQIVTIMCNHNTFPPAMSSLSPSFRRIYKNRVCSRGQGDSRPLAEREAGKPGGLAFLAFPFLPAAFGLCWRMRQRMQCAWARTSHPPYHATKGEPAKPVHSRGDGLSSPRDGEQACSILLLMSFASRVRRRQKKTFKSPC